MIMFNTIQRALINLLNLNVPVKIEILDKLSIYKTRDLIDIFLYMSGLFYDSCEQAYA